MGEVMEDIQHITANELQYLLHNSTVSNEDHDRYTYILNNGDMVDKWELWQLLQISQRTPFLDYDMVSNKDINYRLEWIMKRN